MSKKTQEIELLTQLLKLDGYFADAFGKEDIAKMEINISSDFPILMGTKLQTEYEALCQQNHDKTQLEKNNNNLLNQLMGMGETLGMAMEAMLLSNDSMVVSRAYELFDLVTIVKWKLTNHVELNDADKKYLLTKIA